MWRDAAAEFGKTWSYFSTAEQLEQLLAYLNEKGIKEKALLKILTEYKNIIIDGFKKRERAEKKGGKQSARLANAGSDYKNAFY